MVLEWLFLCAVLIAAVLVVRRAGRGMPTGGWILLALVGCGLLYGLGLRRRHVEAANADRAYLADVLPRPRDDNEYVGSDACQACHPGEHASWHGTYHRTMTQRATPETVRGDFDDVTLRFYGRTYHLSRQDDKFFVEMIDPSWELRKFGGKQAPLSQLAGAPRKKLRVVMMTGSHHYQVYWVPGAIENQLHFVPLAYLFKEKRWIPRDDAFLQHPDLKQHVRLWNVNCVECHSTGGQPKATTPTGDLGVDTRAAELGIACEACHGPGREHVEKHRNPLTRFRALSDDEIDPTIVNPANLPHDRSTEVCGQCHSISFITNPEKANYEGFPYRPGDNLLTTRPPLLPGRERSRQHVAIVRSQDPGFIDSHYWGDGEVRVAGRDFTALAISGCYERGEISCLSCHSLHSYEDPSDQLIGAKMGDESCLQCHTEYRDNPQAHTYHAPTSEGSRCMNCHMAHTTYGLLGAIRSHAISSPSVKTNLRSGRPNACNLCHLDQSLAWTAEHLTKWYGQLPLKLNHELKTTAAGPLWTLKGEAGVRAIVAWHFRWGPAQQASGTDWMAPYLSQLLVDPYSAVRFIAHKSLRTLPGYDRVEFDYVGRPSHWIEVRKAVERAWGAKARSRKPNELLLLDEKGLLQHGRYVGLQKTRDKRKVGLSE